jgi:hypothetical protein
MAKSNGKLKYDLALSTTSVYDASSVYISKSAELSINGNANLEYKTIGPTYQDNQVLWPNITNLIPGPATTQGKAYLYVRNLGPANAANLRISGSTAMDNTDVLPTPTPDGVPDNYDPDQFAEIAINEFAFIPICQGASSLGIFMRSGHVAGSVNWGTNPVYNEIEFMLCYTTPNTVGPTY